MKKVKYILFSAVILSFLFITACSTTKSVSSDDDVYYSVVPHENQTVAKTRAAAVSPAQTKNTPPNQNTGTKTSGTQQAYQEGTVENITASSGQMQSAASADNTDSYDVDYSARLKRFHDSNDTTLDYYDDYYEGRTLPGESSDKKNGTSSGSASTNVFLGLGFGSPYFGSSWSFGLGYPYAGWDMGFGFGWGYPSYGWGYPPYYGYYPPYYGYYPPYYGYYPPYYGYYPPYYGYYPPYYPVYPGYPDVGYSSSVYRPRVSRTGGSSVPGGVVAGGSGVYSAPASRSSSSGKRAPIHPTGRDGKTATTENHTGRPAGSVRYNAALARQHARELHPQDKLAKPTGSSVVRRNYAGSGVSRFGVSETHNRNAAYRKAPAYLREESMPRPRFEKPKQYRSLESRSPRSSKEFYRGPVRPSGSQYRNRGAAVVHTGPQPSHVQNVFRPSGSRNRVYRSRPVHTGVKVYSAPTRTFSSPNIYRGPVRRGSSGSGGSVPRTFTPPTRSITVPVHVRTSGSGGGSVPRSTGSGGKR
jgi:hypothetical protein